MRVSPLVVRRNRQVNWTTRTAAFYLMKADAEPQPFHSETSQVRWVDEGENDNAIIQLIRSSPTPIAVFGYSYFDQNRGVVSDITIDGEAASIDAIAGGRYPLARSLYFYVNGARARPMLAWDASSPQADLVMAVRGPVSLTTANTIRTMSEKFNAFPNPARDGWQFTGLQPGEEISLQDAVGREVFRGCPQGKDFRLLPAGCYSARNERGFALKLLKN
jgi:hypothetical protein